jgi:membrane protease subunit (stomatin/prohibitin family)
LALALQQQQQQRQQKQQQQQERSPAECMQLLASCVDMGVALTTRLRLGCLSQQQ